MPNTQLDIVLLLSLIIAVISNICSIMNIVLIKIMKKWNGYLAILIQMSIFQIIYDSFFPIRAVGNSSSSFQYTTTGIKFFSSLCVSIWSNILILIILRLVITGKILDILKNFYLLSSIAIIPSLIFSIITVVASIVNGHSSFITCSDIYYWGKLISIFVNFCAFFIINYRISRFKSFPGIINFIFFPNSKTHFDTKSIELTPQELAIDILAKRMFYYPLIQAFCRLGASIYEGVYGYDKYEGNSSDKQFALALIYYTTAPAIGIGYLIIFLIMQPQAYQHLKSLLFTCKPATTDTTPTIKEINNDRIISFESQENTEHSYRIRIDSSNNETKSVFHISREDDDLSGNLFDSNFLIPEELDDNSLMEIITYGKLTNSTISRGMSSSYKNSSSITIENKLSQSTNNSIISNNNNLNNNTNNNKSISSNNNNQKSFSTKKDSLPRISEIILESTNNSLIEIIDMNPEKRSLYEIDNPFKLSLYSNDDNI